MAAPLVDPHRDWSALRRLKEASWLQLQRARSPDERLAAGEALRLHVRAARPDWPLPEERLADLDHHVRLAALMRRALPRSGQASSTSATRPRSSGLAT